MSLRTLGLLLLIAASLAHADPSATTVTPTYRFTAGDIRYYRGQETTVTTTDGNDSTATITSTLKSRVTAVKDGAADLNRFTTALKKKAGQSTGKKTEKTSEAQCDRLGNLLLWVLDDAKIDANVDAALHATNPRDFQRQELGNNPTGFVVPFPAHPIQVGDTWMITGYQTVEDLVAPMRRDVTITYTLKSVREEGGHILLDIRSKSKFTAKLTEGSLLELFAYIRKSHIDSELEGTAESTTLFDLTAGEVVSAKYQYQMSTYLVNIDKDGTRSEAEATKTITGTLTKLDKPPK